MATQHIVVDGSNIATEGRQLPSLAQLESALEEVRRDFPDAEVTVVVDATFAHRIDPSELPRYEEEVLHGDLVSPPAGAIGRGDAFLLRIAEKVDGTVLSNDSFQEFHGEHPWLFERGRLLGATPVPGVGWIFVPRTPVRGPKSRVAVRDASRAKARVTVAIAQATREVEHPEAKTPKAPQSPRSRTRRPVETPQAVNDPITFITFIAEHHLGDEIDGVVDSFTSHGAVVTFGEVRCYAPLGNLADPPPRSAREVLHRGDHKHFVITALDPYRRGIELSLPGVGEVSGRPREETVEGEVQLSRRSRAAEAKATDGAEAPGGGAVSPTKAAPTRSTRRRRRHAPSTDGASSAAPGLAPRDGGGADLAEAPTAATVSPAAAISPAEGAAKKAPRKAPAKKAPPAKAVAKTSAAKKAAATKAAANKLAPSSSGVDVASASPNGQNELSRTPQKTSGAKKAPAKKSPAAKAVAKKTPAKKAAAKKASSAAEGPQPRRSPRRTEATA